MMSKSVSLYTYSQSHLPLNSYYFSLRMPYICPIDVIVFWVFLSVPVIPKWNISAISKNSTTIDAQWSGYPDKSVRVHKYMAICTSGNNLTAETANGESRSLKLANLVPYTEYTVQMLAFIGNSSNTSFANRNETVKRSQDINLTTLDDGEK